MLLATPNHPRYNIQKKPKKKYKNLLMEVENYEMFLIDRLWFHQNILFPQPSLFHPTADTKFPVDSSEYSSKQISFSSQEIDEEGGGESTRLRLEKTESHSHSSSPISSQKKSRNLPRLRKSMSCKSLIELELEEVRGFIDLGFNFRRENLSNHIISLLPGLQRIDGSCKFDEINDDDEENMDVMRPYLSESWIIRKPDSPLLNLKMPRLDLCSAADMKKHLKFWAQTVASAVQET